MVIHRFRGHQRNEKDYLEDRAEHNWNKPPQRLWPFEARSFVSFQFPRSV